MFVHPSVVPIHPFKQLSLSSPGCGVEVHSVNFNVHDLLTEMKDATSSFQILVWPPCCPASLPDIVNAQMHKESLQLLLPFPPSKA